VSGVSSYARPDKALLIFGFQYHRWQNIEFCFKQRRGPVKYYRNGEADSNSKICYQICHIAPLNDAMPLTKPFATMRNRDAKSTEYNKNYSNTVWISGK
jgi:hypothetical protein